MDMLLPKRCFNVEQVISATDFSCQIKFRCRQGDGEATIYQLSPAILMAFFDFRAKAYLLNKNRRTHILEINYCTNGRGEHILADNSLQYLGKNDLTFALESSHTAELSFPLGYYSGIGIVIDLDNTAALKRIFSPRVNVDIQEFSKKILSYGSDLCIAMEPCIQNLHVIPQHLSGRDVCTWLSLKVNELLLYLNHYPFNQEQPREIYERQQVEVIKDIHKKMVNNLHSRYTIEELSKEYFISSTKLKTTFKGVYGESIGSYMMNYRIRQAGEWLRESEMSVEKISELLGYRSISKFSTAFKGIMSCSPVMYRKNFKNI